MKTGTGGCSAAQFLAIARRGEPCDGLREPGRQLHAADATLRCRDNRVAGCFRQGGRSDETHFVGKLNIGDEIPHIEAPPEAGYSDGIRTPDPMAVPMIP